MLFPNARPLTCIFCGSDMAESGQECRCGPRSGAEVHDGHTTAVRKLSAPTAGGVPGDQGNLDFRPAITDRLRTPGAIGQEVIYCDTPVAARIHRALEIGRAHV